MNAVDTPEPAPTALGPRDDVLELDQELMADEDGIDLMPRMLPQAWGAVLSLAQFDLEAVLDSARALAQVAAAAQLRSNEALYHAVGAAHDFALTAAEAPGEFARLLGAAGLEPDPRAPMAPVVRLVFGADYDKTRLSEYAAVLMHARRLGVARGVLPRFLLDVPGGLKGVVQAERALRQQAAGRLPVLRTGPRPRVASVLRAMPARSLADLGGGGDEFVLVLARRGADGTVAVLGEVPRDLALLDRAANRLVEAGSQGRISAVAA